MNRNFKALCAALVATVLALASFCNLLIKNTRTVLGEDAVKTIYLTFDDGPSDRVTPLILDVLAEENVKATFFIIGCNAERRKYLVKREFNEGHTVAVHSYSHEYREIYASAESLIRDIDKCNKLIKEITGEYSFLYRFPGGSYGLPDELIEAVTSHGLKYVDWNASTRDAEFYYPDAGTVYRSAIATAEGYENVVLLAHDSTTKTSTAEALRDIIRYFKRKGFIFKTF